MAKSVNLPVLDVTPKREVTIRVPITNRLKALLYPDLFKKEPIFTKPLAVPKDGEKVYDLSHEDIQAIRSIRGSVTDLHPGMGGIAPHEIKKLREEGNVELTSLDFMITRGCNFSCTYCYAESDPFQTAYLPFEVLKRLTNEARELGVSLFVLTGGEPLLYKDPQLGKGKRGGHFFRVVDMIDEVYKDSPKRPKKLTFDDVALITPEIAQSFADRGVGLCTKGDTLIKELQDFRVNQVGAFKKMQAGYGHLKDAGYGQKGSNLRLVVNSVLDHTTFDNMVDTHIWVMQNRWDHSIVPVHYCGKAEHEDQEAGIHSPHVFVLYHLLAHIDKEMFGIEWKPHAAFPYDKTCNRARGAGLHIRANGDVTSCSESPPKEVTPKYTFGNVLEDPEFSLVGLVRGDRMRNYRTEFNQGHGAYVCSPNLCDLNAEDLCGGGCAVRSAYSRVDYNTGLIVRNDNPNNYSQRREDPLCPAWTVLALKQRILKPGLLETIHKRLLERSRSIDKKDFPFIQPTI